MTSRLTATSDPVTESTGRDGPLPVAVRVEAQVSEAARRIRKHWFPRARKTYKHVTPKKLSVARHTGGAVGETIRLMHANPAAAVEIGTYLLATARAIASTTRGCVTTALLVENEADSAEDVSGFALMAEIACTERMRHHVRNLDVAIAAGLHVRDVLAAELACRGAA